MWSSLTYTLYCRRCSIERDAQLLANRIALLKQEEQKTWKKIDDTKKRTNEILTLKKRNEDRIQKVRDNRRDIVADSLYNLAYLCLHFRKYMTTKSKMRINA